jgi:hypothetical protein
MSKSDTSAEPPQVQKPAEKPAPAKEPAKAMPKEYGGPTGPEPTRYGDWERNGKVSDF